MTLAARIAIVVLSLLTWILPRTPAAAVTTCLFDAGGGTATVTVTGSEIVRVARVVDAIAVNGIPCGLATVTNTDLIDVVATDPLATGLLLLDLTGGPLAPGATDEGDGSSEIEIESDSYELTIRGSDGDDLITVRSAAVNLNAGEATFDEDVLAPVGALLAIRSGEGADVLSLDGGPGHPSSFETPRRLFAGPGADRLIGEAGDREDWFDGGPGLDTADYSMAETEWLFWEEDAAVVEGNSSHDTLTQTEIVALGRFDDRVIYEGSAEGETRAGPGVDVITVSEAVDVPAPPGDRVVRGGPDPDFLNVLPGQPVEVDLDRRTIRGGWFGSYSSILELRTGEGADRFVATKREGYPYILGGTGFDELALRMAPRRMFVAMDTLPDELHPWLIVREVERVIGSRFDDVLVGDDTILNHLYGLEGNDVLRGLGQFDQIVGGPGDDTIAGGPGTDRCRGGAGVDRVTGCEQFGDSFRR